MNQITLWRIGKPLVLNPEEGLDVTPKMCKQMYPMFALRKVTRNHLRRESGYALFLNRKGHYFGFRTIEV